MMILMIHLARAEDVVEHELCAEDDERDDEDEAPRLHGLLVENRLKIIIRVRKK